MGWLLASEGESVLWTVSTCSDDVDDRVRLPTDATRLVKGVDVLPWVLAPLMGPEEYDIEVCSSWTYTDEDLIIQDMEQLPPTLQFLPPEKKRDQDPILRMMCIEILLLLSTSKHSR